MVRETWVQSLVKSYQRLKKWYLIPPCLTLSNIRHVSRVKWNNPEKGEVPSSTCRCSSYRKGSLLVALDYGCQLYYYYLCIKYWILKYHYYFYLMIIRRVPCGIVANVLKCGHRNKWVQTPVMLLYSPFRLIPLGKAWTPLCLYIRMQHHSEWVQTPVMLLHSLSD